MIDFDMVDYTLERRNLKVFRCPEAFLNPVNAVKLNQNDPFRIPVAHKRDDFSPTGKVSSARFLNDWRNFPDVLGMHLPILDRSNRATGVGPNAVNSRELPVLSRSCQSMAQEHSGRICRDSLVL
jgi:hypothetical protein